MGARAGKVAVITGGAGSLGGGIDVLFSNAGNFGIVAPIADYPEDVFDSVYAVHVRGAFLACNTIHPGPIDNGFQLAVEKGLGEAIGGDGTAFFNALIPLHRHAAPEEIASSVLYLATDQSSFTTGAMLMVDGGMSV